MANMKKPVLVIMVLSSIYCAKTLSEGKEKECLDIVGAGMYNQLLEGMCNFNGNVSKEIINIYNQSKCPSVLHSVQVENLAKDVLLDTRQRYMEMGKDNFCEANKERYRSLMGHVGSSDGLATKTEKINSIKKSADLCKSAHNQCTNYIIQKINFMLGDMSRFSGQSVKLKVELSDDRRIKSVMVLNKENSSELRKYVEGKVKVRERFQSLDVLSKNEFEQVRVIDVDVIPQVGILNLKIQGDVSFEHGMPTLNIQTNLPEGTVIMATVTKTGSLLADGYAGQQSSEIDNAGNVKFGPFSDNNNLLSSGDYQVIISTPLTGIQPENVRLIIGEHGEKLSGPSIVKILPNMPDFGVNYKFNFHVN